MMISLIDCKSCIPHFLYRINLKWGIFVIGEQPYVVRARLSCLSRQSFVAL